MTVALRATLPRPIRPRVRLIAAGAALFLALGGCRAVLDVGEGRLSAEEKTALQSAAGSRLAIDYRRDWARPSRLLLVLWVIFGGSGVVWVYWRYSRR